MNSKKNYLPLILSLTIGFSALLGSCLSAHYQIQEQLRIQEEQRQLEEIKHTIAEIESTLSDIKSELNTENKLEMNDYNKDISENKDVETNSDMYSSESIDVEVTAYDLSPEDCEKDRSDPYYGITAYGHDLTGHTLESARIIAVDPDVIPLGSEVHIAFHDEDYQHLNGIYVAADVGGAIVGNKIDLFFGDSDYVSTTYEMYQFGRRKATVTIL